MEWDERVEEGKTHSKSLSIISSLSTTTYQHDKTEEEPNSVAPSLEELLDEGKGGVVAPDKSLGGDLLLGLVKLPLDVRVIEGEVSHPAKVGLGLFGSLKRGRIHSHQRRTRRQKREGTLTPLPKSHRGDSGIQNMTRPRIAAGKS